MPKKVENLCLRDFDCYKRVTRAFVLEAAQDRPLLLCLAGEYLRVGFLRGHCINSPLPVVEQCLQFSGLLYLFLCTLGSNMWERFSNLASVVTGQVSLCLCATDFD